MRATEYGRMKENPAFATFEHLLPKSKGGSGHAKNIVLSHGACNNARLRKRWPHDPVYGNGDKLPPEVCKPKLRLPYSEPRRGIKARPIVETMDVLRGARMLTKVGIE